jgi:hypothetical protein
MTDIFSGLSLRVLYYQAVFLPSQNVHRGKGKAVVKGGL